MSSNNNKIIVFNVDPVRFIENVIIRGVTGIGSKKLVIVHFLLLLLL